MVIQDRYIEGIEIPELKMVKEERSLTLKELAEYRS